MLNLRDKPKPASVSKHPSQNFIKYLLITEQTVSSTLKSLDLPDLPLGYIESLGQSIPNPPKEFEPTNRYHKESKEYIKNLGVYNLFFPDKATTEAKHYLTDFEVRPFVEKLLLSRMKPLEIAKRINSKLDTLCTEEGIDRYRHYFWNVNIMRIDDWSKLLSHTPERHKMLSIAKNGASYALNTLGFIQKIEAKEALREALNTIYFDMQDWKNKPTSPEKTKAFSTIIRDISLIDDKLSSVDITMKETLKQFESFRVTHVHANIKPIQDVAEIGNYSNSGMILTELDNKKMLTDGELVFDIDNVEEEEE